MEVCQLLRQVCGAVFRFVLLFKTKPNFPMFSFIVGVACLRPFVSALEWDVTVGYLLFGCQRNFPLFDA